MPHFPKPFFRPSRKLWYVQVDGKQVNLGPDRDAAFDQYHRLMTAKPRPVVAMPGMLLLALVDAFLEYCQLHKAPDTFRWYRDRLQQFVTTIPVELRVEELRPFHVQQWIDAHPEWAPGTRRNAIRSIKRALHWGEEQGHIEKSPIAHMRKPKGGHKEQVVSQGEFDKLLSVCTNECLRDLLIVTWETGCRPQESLRVEARHVDLGNKRWVFPQSEGKTGLRVVYLTEKALEITCQLVAQHPAGKLFRNSAGVPWTTDAVNSAFKQLRHKLGRQRIDAEGVQIDEASIRKFAATLKCERIEDGQRRAKTERELFGEARRKLLQRKACSLVPNYSLYALRHSWATHALERGVDPLTTAILMGHSDPSMLAKVYQHLALNPDHLRSQLAKAVGSGEGTNGKP